MRLSRGGRLKKLRIRGFSQQVAELPQRVRWLLCNVLAGFTEFVGGHFMNAAHGALTPADLIGWILSPIEAQRLLTLLGYTRPE